MAESVSLSVIVPVYNGEPYLGQCLASLSAQTVSDVEFICVDDGSTDRTLEMLRGFERADSRFKVISKENSGYGRSMNVGIAAAHGDYIGFLESDDWVEPSAFEMLVSLAYGNGMPDIVKANHYVFDDGSGEERFLENYPESICGRVIRLPGEEYRNLVLSAPAIWAAVYRGDFLSDNRIRFLETPGASYQDTGFVFKSWAAASSAYVTHEGFLHYRYGNAGSSTVSAAKENCVLDEWESIAEYVEACGLDDPTLHAALAAKKFQTYYWNIRRISSGRIRGFAEAARADLLRERERGNVDQLMFTPAQWDRFNQWVDDPDGLVLDMLIRKEPSSPKRAFLRARRKARRFG